MQAGAHVSQPSTPTGSDLPMMEPICAVSDHMSKCGSKRVQVMMNMEEYCYGMPSIGVDWSKHKPRTRGAAAFVLLTRSRIVASPDPMNLQGLRARSGRPLRIRSIRRNANEPRPAREPRSFNHSRALPPVIHGPGEICRSASHMLPNLAFWEAALEPIRLKRLKFNGTAAPARTGDPQIHNLVL